MDTPTGTALSKLTDWLPLYETHTNRFLLIVGRQQKIFHQWCDALKYPVDSFEHKVIIQKLYEEMMTLTEDSNETLVDIGNDFYLLKDVFLTSQNEMTKLKEENVSRTTPTDS